MPKKLIENEYGFLVSKHNPFFIFPYLQELAKNNFPADKIYDLSRGNPGLSFCPAKDSREFFGFLITADTILNCNKEGYRIHKKNKSELAEVREKIKKCALENYKEEVAQKHLATLDKVIEKIIAYAKEENMDMNEIDVLHGIFDYSTLAGGTYHDPKGELVTRVVLGGFYRQLLQSPEIKADDFILTLGVNDAIGTLFKMFGEEHFGFLKKGDAVAISAPAYAPYFNEINARGLVPLEIEFDCNTTKVDFSAVENYPGEIKAFFIISPNNPAGLKYENSSVKKIMQLAQKNNSLVITDEIYFQFHKELYSLWTKDKKRTIFLSGRSKIERAPGLRFGNALIGKETNKYLSDRFREKLTAPDFKTEFIWMKAPGSVFASFQHTAAVPGPSQILGILHILLGEAEKKQYVKMINQNMENFFSALKMPRNDAVYYTILDLNAIPGNIKKNVSIEQKLFELASQVGVALVPALKFFSPASQSKSDKSNFVRVSLANLSPDQAAIAGKKIREYLTEE